MLNSIQISRQVSDLGKEAISPDDFERWFRAESRDFLAWGDANLQAVVFAVEGVLSDYRFDGLPESGLAGELADAVRPFVESEGMSPAENSIEFAVPPIDPAHKRQPDNHPDGHGVGEASFQNSAAIQWHRNRASNVSQYSPGSANNADVAFNSFAA